MGARVGGACSLWKLFPGLAQALSDDLPGSGDVGGVCEFESDLGKAELGDAAHLGHLRETGEGEFQRASDLTLDLFRGEGGDGRVDHHLLRGHIGDRVDGEPERGKNSDDEEGQSREGYQRAVVDGEADEAVQHRLILREHSNRRRGSS